MTPPGRSCRPSHSVRATSRGSEVSRAWACVAPLLVAALLVAAACGGQRAPSPASPGSSAVLPPGADSVQAALRPGDAVLLKVWREKEMSDTLRVDEDGRLTLPLLGTRDVGGVPADSLRRRLIADYREYLDTPAIELRVLRRISVLGEVQRPGLYPVDPSYTLTDALALAGGPTPQADRSDVRLLRDGEVVRKSLDRHRTIAYTPIRSGDQIMVGRRSWFSRNWQWLIGTAVSASVILITR